MTPFLPKIFGKFTVNFPNLWNWPKISGKFTVNVPNYEIEGMGGWVLQFGSIVPNFLFFVCWGLPLSISICSEISLAIFISIFSETFFCDIDIFNICLNSYINIFQKFWYIDNIDISNTPNNKCWNWSGAKINFSGDQRQIKCARKSKTIPVTRISDMIGGRVDLVCLGLWQQQLPRLLMSANCWAESQGQVFIFQSRLLTRYRGREEFHASKQNFYRSE